MRKPAIVVSMMFLSAALASAQGQSPWKEVSSSEDGFAVSFPGTPEISTEPVVEGQEPATQQSWEVSTEDRLFSVAVLRFPPGKAPKDPGETYFTSLVAAYAQVRGAKVRAQTATVLAGQKGVEAIIERPEQNISSVLNIIASGDRVYLLASAYVGPKEQKKQEVNADNQRFRDSFRLLASSSSTEQHHPEQAHEKDKWDDFHSAETGFTASFPGVPEANITRQSAATLYSYEVDRDERSTFAMKVIEFSPEVVPPKPDDDYYTQMINAYTMHGSKVLKRSSVTIGGHSGAEAVIDVVEVGHATALLDIIAFGDRVYLILSVGPKGLGPSSDSMRFRDSVHFLDK
jgi:hypothetical protein